MKKSVYIIAGLLWITAASGCAVFKPKAAVDKNAGAAVFASYSGPKARVAVADFEVRAAKANGEIGSGLREMLVSALVNSNHFVVLERQALNAVTQEQELASSAASYADSGGPQKGKIQSADLIITAALTEFEPQASGGRGGIGGGGGVNSGALGGLLGAALNQAHIALDIRIVDSSTTVVLAATRVQGQASDISGTVMSGFLGNWALANGLTIYAKTPLEKAVRICIIEAVRYISQTVPSEYYRYSNEGKENGEKKA